MDCGLSTMVDGLSHAKGIPSPKGCPWHGEGMPYGMDLWHGRQKNNYNEMSDQTFVLTDGSENSYGFCIDMAALKLNRFKANPVMLYNHGELVGKWENLRVEEGRLLGSPVYMEDEDERLSLKIKKRVENGFVKGASVGIHILGTREKKGQVLVEAEVFECSLCDIPSNRNAIALYDKEGMKLKGQELTMALQEINNNELDNKNNDMKLSEASCRVLGIGGDSSVEEINQAIAVLNQKMESLQGKLDKIEKQKVKNLIDQGLAEGRLTEDKRASFEQLAQTNYELAEQTIASLPGKETLAGKEQPSAASGEDRSKWTFDDWRKKDSAGLLAIKAKEPEKYAQIIKN